MSPEVRRLLLDSCPSLAADGPVVRRYSIDQPPIIHKDIRHESC